MFKGLILGIIIGILLVFAGVWFYFTSGHAPVATAEPPMPMERKLAGEAIEAYLDKKPHSDAPVPASEATYLAGADVYKKNCAVCHGVPEGEQTNIAEGMFPRPPRLLHGTGVTDDPVWQTYWVVKGGIRMTGMPGFTGRLTDTELWQVSVLLANADKISPAVKAALAGEPVSATTSPADQKNSSATLPPTKK